MSCRLACKHDAVDDKRLRLGHPAKRDLETSASLQATLNQPQTCECPGGQTHVVGRWHIAFSGVDAHQTTIGMDDHLVAERPHRCDGRARPHLDDDRTTAVSQPVVQRLALAGLAFIQPAPVAEHQDVGPSQSTAAWTGGGSVE